MCDPMLGSDCGLWLWAKNPHAVLSARPDYYPQLTEARRGYCMVTVWLWLWLLTLQLTQVPIWLAATLLWAWNNSRNVRHVRDLHRRLAFVPLLGFAQATPAVVPFGCPSPSCSSTILVVVVVACYRLLV